MSRTWLRFGGIATVVVLLLAACTGDGGGSTAASANGAKGPIKIWYSNKRGGQLGQGHGGGLEHGPPGQQVTGEEIPAGKSSEEVIGAAITAGNTPCLIFNTAPAAVPQFQKQGGLVALDSFPDGAQYIKDRTGDLADQYKSSDGKMYQLPWKSNPVVLFYNKDVFAKAGLDPEKPKLRPRRPSSWTRPAPSCSPAPSPTP